MALFTLTVNAQNNQPPDRIGDLSLALTYNQTYTFTEADFTTGTSPEYNDPEGDSLQSIQVKTLPTLGTLELNSVAVVALDEITVADINSNLFTYIADPAETAGYTDSNFTWDAKDTGSLTFAGLTGTVTFIADAEVNLAPSAVGNNSKTTDFNSTIVFTTADFTTDTTPAYADPEGDAAANLQVLSLPASGTLKLSGVDVKVNQIISFADITSGFFTYVPDNSIIGGTTVDFNFQIADAGSGLYTS